MSALGSCLLDNDQIDEIAAWLQEPDFYRAAHGEVFRAILELRDAGKPVDAVTLADHLIARGRFEAIGGDEFLREICESVPHAANGIYYAKIIRERSIARQILECVTETIEEVYSNLHTAQELVERHESRVFAITDRSVAAETIDAETLVDETWGRLRTLQEKRSVGLPTGFTDLDDMVAGLIPGQYVILAARPGVGKTALALNIAGQVAAGGTGVLFVSIEMGRVELGNRLLASIGMVDGSKLLKPWFMRDEDWAKLGNACAEISRFPLFIDDAPVRTTSQIAAGARRIRRRSPVGLGLIVVDYLGLISGQKTKGESRQEEVAGISRRLRAIGKSLRVPMLVLHQLNRSVESRDDRRPRKSDLRESGQIEQDADVILLLHRRDDQPGIVEVIVDKNRNGTEGTVRLAFNGPLTRFDSLAPDIPDIPRPDGPAF